MAFELQQVTAVTCTHANTRVEMHGKTEKVRAIDHRWRLTGDNHLLNKIQPGLREHFYRNKEVEDAIAAGQHQLLPNEAIPLPNLRYPLLATENVKWSDKAHHGYRWLWDWGTESDHYDFTDVAVSNITIENMQEGGTVSILFTTQYNGEELNDNATYGELAGLAAMGELHIQLLAPAKLLPVTKGWRSGKADVPATTDNGAPLLEHDGPSDGNDHQDGEHDHADTGDQHPQGDFAEGSPEAALLDAVQQQPDPLAPPVGKRGRGKRAAAGATLQ
jgi:hypothetical protein